jgi:hypothetical protein
VTWNATAELFINTGNNSRLDPLLFVPVCTIDPLGMHNILKFPSYGEMADLGGPGPSLGMLYQYGNSYIQANKSWDAMAETSRVHVATAADGVAAIPKQGVAAIPKHGAAVGIKQGETGIRKHPSEAAGS